MATRAVNKMDDQAQDVKFTKPKKVKQTKPVKK